MPNEPSPNDCCLCFDTYDFDTAGGQAVTLLCGHSFCRQCLLLVVPPLCPTCRKPFRGNVASMAPTYSLQVARAEPPKDNVPQDMEAAAATAPPLSAPGLGDATLEGLSSERALDVTMQGTEGVAAARISALEAQVESLQLNACSAGQTRQQEIREATNQAAHMEASTEAMNTASRQPETAEQRVGAAAASSATAAAAAAVAAPTAVAAAAGDQTWPMSGLWAQLGRLAGALLPTSTPSPIPTQRASQSPPVHTSNTCSSDSTSSSSRSTGSVVGDVMWVTSTDLKDVLHAMRQNGAPAVYDFQGRELRYTGAGDPVIASSGVTWRNGALKLRGKSLVVKRSGVVLHTISVLGAACGVCVVGSGSLTMKSCEVRDADVGVSLEGSSSLQASNLKVLNSKTDGLTMKGSASANLTDCELAGTGNHGVCASHSSSLVGLRVRVVGVRGDVFCLKHSARVDLTRCDMTGNVGGAGSVRHSASLQLSGCELEGRVVTKHSGTVQMVP